MERHARCEHAVGRGERGCERLGREEAAVAGGVQVGEVEHRSDPLEPAADRDHIVERAQLTHASHHLDAERDGARLCEQALPQLAELSDHSADRLGAPAAEQEAGMDHNRRRAAGHCDPGGVVERRRRPRAGRTA